MTPRRYTRLQGPEREAARILAAQLYTKEGMSITDIVAEFSLRERPVSFGTVHTLLNEAQVDLRPAGGTAGRRLRPQGMIQ